MYFFKIPLLLLRLYWKWHHVDAGLANYGHRCCVEVKLLSFFILSLSKLGEDLFIVYVIVYLLTSYTIFRCFIDHSGDQIQESLERS